MAHKDVSFSHEVERAARALETDKQGLARYLGLSVGSLRLWEARGAPIYARLALAALAVKLDPDSVLDTWQSRSECDNPDDEARSSFIPLRIVNITGSKE